MDESFVLGFIIGSRPEDLKDIIELLSIWQDKKDTSAYAS
jgi:hypothetical protein